MHVCLCVCLCVVVYVWLWVGALLVCVCMRKSEDNLGCCSSNAFQILFEVGSLSGLEFHQTD